MERVTGRIGARAPNQVTDLQAKLAVLEEAALEDSDSDSDSDW